MLLLLAVAGTSGCVSLASNLIHAIYGNDVKPEYQGLKDQTIIVMCSNEAGIGKDDVTQQVGDNLRAAIGNKLPKTTLVRQTQIDQWLDEHSDVTDPTAEIGKALKADVVISVDMRNLTLKDGQTLFRGRVDFTAEVFSVAENKIVFRRSVPEYTYPLAAAISTTEMEPTKFKRLYLLMASERISRLFIPSPIGSDIANDAKILQYQ